LPVLSAILAFNLHCICIASTCSADLLHVHALPEPMVQDRANPRSVHHTGRCLVPTCLCQELRGKAAHHAVAACEQQLSDWADTRTALPILVPADIGICSDYALPTSWSRAVLTLLLMIGILPLRCTITCRRANADVKKGSRQGFSDTHV
jgi:hypothetical protein